jgi:Flp pilus assembly pilin Flp
MPKVLNNLLSRFLVWAAAEDGQGLTEYALILALIGLVAVVALTTLGHGVTSVFTTVARSA